MSRRQKQPLRPRIEQVLSLLAQGHREPYIAYHLGLKLSTVSSYLTDIRQQYALGDTHAEMVQNAQERGLIEKKKS